VFIRLGTYNFGTEAEVEVELDKLGSVLQLQLQRQGIVPFGAMKPTDWLHLLFGALEAYGSASCSPLAIWSLGIGLNFPLSGEAEVEMELNKLGSVQLQLQLQRQVSPPPPVGRW
jgi:hypothetical protein